MPNFGFQTSVGNFSNTVHNAIQKRVLDTLRAGLIALPKGSVWAADLGPMRGENFTVTLTQYPDLLDAAVTNPLTEGTPPAALVLGVDTTTFTVAQIGAWTTVTDVAQFQSPHNLQAVAVDKIARLAVQSIDNIALTALAAHTVDKEYTGLILGTNALLDIKGELNARNVQPVPGAGYYALCHPYALRGLEGETNLNGYVDVTSHNAAQAASLTAGAVAQYRGITFLKSSRVAGVLSATRTGPTGAFATDIYTLAAHGLSNGIRIQFVTLTGGGTNVVINTDYYVRDVTTNTFKIAATKGGVAIDLNTSDITASTWKTEQFPIYFLGQASIGAGDVSTLEYLRGDGVDSANPLRQYSTVGFKGIFGCKVITSKDTVSGAGSLGSAVDRMYTATVMSGETL
jgi:N4-gp56 family major capsid protein